MSQIYSFDSASLVSFFANSAKVFPTNAKGYAPVSIAGISEICDELVAEFEGDDDFALKLAAPVLAVEQLLNIATASDPAIEVDESSIMTVLVDQDMGVVAKVFGPGIFASPWFSPGIPPCLLLTSSIASKLGRRCPTSWHLPKVAAVST